MNVKPQDSKALVDTAPEALRGLPRAVTALAGAVDRIVNGESVKGTLRKRLRAQKRRRTAG